MFYCANIELYSFIEIGLKFHYCILFFRLLWYISPFLYSREYSVLKTPIEFHAFPILCCSERKTKFECRCFSTELRPIVGLGLKARTWFLVPMWVTLFHWQIWLLNYSTNLQMTGKMPEYFRHPHQTQIFLWIYIKHKQKLLLFNINVL